jgi:N utilization substance protein B
VRSRTKAREIALQLLYEYDATKELSEVRIDSFLAECTEKEEAREYASMLVAGVLEYMKKLDEIVEQFAEHWAVTRMPVVDRNILRIGVFELLYEKDVPAKVVINEAVEIAKRFGSADSGRFVNAILDRIYKESLRQDKNKQP